MRILVVEDEEDLAEVLVEALEGQRYAVDRAGDGATADEMVCVNDYDLVVLDWTLPGKNGVDLLKSWRSAGRQVPVLMLTGRSGLEDRIGGLDSGADDYLTKPFSLEELFARARSLLRRRERVLQTYRAEDLELDPAARRATVAGAEVRLAPKEFAVLEYLLSRLDQVVTRSELAEHAWDESFDAMSNVIDVVIYRLRRKVDGDRPVRLLHTLKGAGYLLKSRRE
ncbi:MAG: response regulator transcription factor [Thermoanaerobaculia bacterium]|nr:response regulator transcription factor [Thermoanaerobaculia bacterium]